MATTNAASDLTPVASALGTSHPDKTVELTLSVFLSAVNAKRLGLNDKEYKPGDKVKVSFDDASALIEQGAGGVDPRDTAAVNKILGVKS